VFSPDEIASYVAQLSKLAKLVGPSIRFYVFSTPMQESRRYKALCEKWETKKKSNFSYQVAMLLIYRKVATFEDVTVIPVDWQPCIDQHTKQGELPP
jgi:hypothetical protein